MLNKCEKNWNVNWLCLTSILLLWLNSHNQVPKSFEKNFQKTPLKLMIKGLKVDVQQTHTLTSDCNVMANR